MRRFMGCLVGSLVLISGLNAQSAAPVLEPITPENVTRLVALVTLPGTPAPLFEDTSAFNDSSEPVSSIVTTSDEHGIEVQLSPEHPIMSLAFPEPRPHTHLVADLSPDERFLAVTLYQKDDPEGATTYVWEIAPATPVLRISAMTLSGRVTWRPDGQQVAIDSNIYDLQTGMLLFQHSVGVQSTELSPCDESRRSVHYAYLSWSPDSTQYAALDYGVCGSEENSFAIFDSRDGSRLLELSQSSLFILQPLLWSADGQRLTSGPSSWSAVTGYRTGYLTHEQMDRGEPQTMWLPDSRSLLSIDSYGMPGIPYTRLYKWDAESGTTLWQLNFWQNTTVSRIDDNTLTLASGFAQLTVDLEIGQILQADPYQRPEPFDHMAWSPDSQRLVIAGDGPGQPTLQMWTRETLLTDTTRAPLWQVNRDWFAHEKAMETELSSQFIPQWRDNSTFATVTWGYVLQQVFTVEQWQADSGDSQGILNPSFESPAFLSPDQTQLIVLPSDNQIQLIDVETQAVTATLDLSSLRQMLRAEWSPSGEWVALHNNYNDFDTDQTAVVLWHVTEPASPPIIIEAALSEHVFWSPVGNDIIFDSHNIYTLPEGEIAASMGRIGLMGVWSPDGRMFLKGYEKSLIFWDVRQGLEVARIPTQGLTRVSWSPDGQIIATIHKDGQLTLWGIPLKP